MDREAQTNIEKLEKYLFGFLQNDRNNGKIVMLSGVWGAGKTHFWKEKIEPKLLEGLTDKKKACVYISLYGKEDIETIKNEILVKSYEIIKGENKLRKRAISAFGTGAKSLSISFFGIKVNLKGLSEAVEGYSQEKMGEEAKSYLVDGGIVCFDDFERKSKKIDLNDLFGFITQLSIDMNCKVVIILNSDVFSGEEAKVFFNVKEKTVNKFLKFNPSKQYLFDSIVKEYPMDEKYKDIFLKSILEMDILNARIYKNIFESFKELIKFCPNLTDSEIRFFVLSLINFNLTHKIFKFSKYTFNDYDDKPYNVEIATNFIEIINIFEKFIIPLREKYGNKFIFISNIKIQTEYKIKHPVIAESDLIRILKKELEVLDKYSDDIWNYWKLDKILNFRENVSLERQKLINDFIENGYL